MLDNRGEAPTGAPRSTKRQRNRIERTRIFLDTAIELVVTEGFDALTMQRLADSTDSAIGAVYRYFPSKGALVAEVQRESVERITASYTLIRDRSDRTFFAGGLDDRELALARAVTFGRFFISLAETFPHEFRLLQALNGEMRTIIPLEEGLRVFPSIVRFMLMGHQVISDAEQAGVFTESDGLDRVTMFAAAVNGVLRLSTQDQYDAELFDGRRLALLLLRDLGRAWGATDEQMAKAWAAVDAVAAAGPLAPQLAADRRAPLTAVAED